jgi:hypothetical protein
MTLTQTAAELGTTKNTIRRDHWDLWMERWASVEEICDELKTGTCLSNVNAAVCGLRPTRSARHRGGGCNGLTNPPVTSYGTAHNVCRYLLFQRILPTMGDTHATSLLCRNDT